MKPGLMSGKRGLVMGVANDHSIAWGIAKAAAEQGAELAFTYQGDALGKRVLPLAESLGLDIDESFAKGEEEALVEKVKAIGGVALIAWQHEKMPEIAELILGADEPFPRHWPGHRFDLVWVFDREDGGNAWRLAQVSQMLLPGDQPDPIPFDK